MRYVEEFQERLELKLEDDFAVERSGEHFLTIEHTGEPRVVAWHYPFIWWLKTFVSFEFGDLVDRPQDELESLGREAARQALPRWEALGFRPTNGLGSLSVRWQPDEGPPRPIYTFDLRHENAATSSQVDELVRGLAELGQFIDITDLLDEV